MNWWTNDDRITLKVDAPEVELDGIVTENGIAWCWSASRRVLRGAVGLFLELGRIWGERASFTVASRVWFHELDAQT